MSERYLIVNAPGRDEEKRDVYGPDCFHTLCGDSLVIYKDGAMVAAYPRGMWSRVVRVTEDHLVEEVRKEEAAHE